MRRVIAPLAVAALTSACSSLPQPGPGIANSTSATTATSVGGQASTAASTATVPPPSPAAVPPAAASAAPADAIGALLSKTASAVPDEPARPAAVPPADVWERIRRGFGMPDLDTPLAASRTRWYASQPAYIDRMAQRASLYLFHIVEEIERRGMPTELALLPFVESAMQPEAVSSAKAAGLWQFIPSTGKHYALEQNMWTDERRNVVESTRAALDYLQKLYAHFGDWHLALAAYNWGEGSVGRAIARNQAQRRPTGYLDLKMPLETQHYVPKLQAIKNIVRDPARHGIVLPAIRNEPYFVAVSKERDIDVETAALLAEMPLAEFRALNPGFNRPVIVGAAQPTLLLPAERAEVFSSNLAAWVATGQPLASWTTYVLMPSETLADIAKRADISEAKLREANRIPARARLAPGSVVLIPRDETMDDISPQHLQASFALLPETTASRRVTYKVRRGDTLQSVARQWRVQADDIKAWNNLRSPTLFAGQRLDLHVNRAPPRATTVRTAATRPSGKASAAKATPTATAQRTANRSAPPRGAPPAGGSRAVAAGSAPASVRN
jgi:membrane-bound lytic murein transglycosylase D